MYFIEIKYIKMNCFICLSSTRQLIQPDCLCKTIYVHPGCYKKWLETCPDILICSICKSTVGINFVKKFVSLEQLMMYSNKVQEPQEPQEPQELQEYVINQRVISIPGIAESIPIYNDTLHFRTITEKIRFMEADKRLYNSKRHSIQGYKKAYRF